MGRTRLERRSYRTRPFCFGSKFSGKGFQVRQMNDQILKEALEFAARWGFLTKDLFYDFICRMSLAQNYRYWRSLSEDGLLVQSKASENVLLLSHKIRRQMFGESARPSRLPAYIDHDSIAARFLMTLQ